jgi:hypothetical protein
MVLFSVRSRYAFGGGILAMVGRVVGRTDLE